MALATRITAFATGLNYQVSLSCLLYVIIGPLTSVMTAPYLIVLSTDFSIDPLISGEYSFSNLSSSWSDDRRASTYAKIISWRGWTVEKVRTVGFAENCISREPLCFPMRTGSVQFDQLCEAGW